MVSLGVRQALKSIAAAAAALGLAAVTTTPALAEALEAEVDDSPLIDQIQEILSRDGPYSSDLLEPLTSLGLLYQEGDDHTFALVTLERALQIVRVNQGLHSLEQIPLARQLIRLEEARGNDAGAWEREQALLTLLRRHPDDLRTVPVLREIADKQMDVLGDVLAGKRPPQILLGCFYKEWPNQESGSCHSGSRKTVIQGMLAEAQRNYSDAIGVMLRRGLYASDELRELELKVLRGVDLLRSLNYQDRSDRPLPMVPAYLSASSIEPWRSRMAPVVALADWRLPYPTGRALEGEVSRHRAIRHAQIMDPYHRGRESLRRLYAYSTASSSPSFRQADAVVQIADWDLLYSRNGQAVASYAAAYAMLAKAAVAQALVEQLFSPQIPVVLPAFQPNPLARDATRPATGHIDVAFEITQYGRGRAIEIRDAVNATNDAMDRLVALIKNNRFRPRSTNGQFAVAAPIVMRYYVYD